MLDFKEVLLEADALGMVPLALVLALHVLLVVVLLRANTVALLVHRVAQLDRIVVLVPMTYLATVISRLHHHLWVRRWQLV